MSVFSTFHLDQNPSHPLEQTRILALDIYTPYENTDDFGPEPLFWPRLHTPVLAPGMRGQSTLTKVGSMYRVPGYNQV